MLLIYTNQAFLACHCGSRLGIRYDTSARFRAYFGVPIHVHAAIEQGVCTLWFPPYHTQNTYLQQIYLQHKERGQRQNIYIYLYSILFVYPLHVIAYFFHRASGTGRYISTLIYLLVTTCILVRIASSTWVQVLCSPWSTYIQGATDIEREQRIPDCVIPFHVYLMMLSLGNFLQFEGGGGFRYVCYYYSTPQGDNYIPILYSPQYSTVHSTLAGSPSAQPSPAKCSQVQLQLQFFFSLLFDS